MSRNTLSLAIGLSIVLWAALLVGIAHVFTGCGRIGDAGVYVVQANNLADEALALEHTIMRAEVPVEQRSGLQQAVNDLRLIAAEARRFEQAEDLTKLELARMHRAYLRVKSNLLYVRSIVYDEPELTVWRSIPEHDRLQLSLFWSDAADLAADIDAFIKDPDTGSYLQMAARMTAYGAIAAKVLVRVVPLILEER